MSAQIPFYKMHGAGNHFVVLDLLRHDLPATSDAESQLRQLAVEVCARGFGAGGDGLLTLEVATEPGAAVRMRMFNPDGTEDMCGNGLRCVAALARRHGHVTGPEFTVQTLAGPRSAHMLEHNLGRIGMGYPSWQPHLVPRVPTTPEQSGLEYDLDVPGEGPLRVVSLTTGSTHTVIFAAEPVSEERFTRLSPLIENHATFPERTSVLWVAPVTEAQAASSTGTVLQVRIWERGVGETLACGTGACAIAVAAQLTGRALGPVTVRSRGGDLQVQWQSDREMVLTGPVQWVYSGVWLLNSPG